MATLTFCFGLMFMMMGIMAEYLHRIFVEAKNRPLYFIAASAGEFEHHPDPAHG
jgi:dolichol-phosphate mannosyltransferase